MRRGLVRLARWARRGPGRRIITAGILAVGVLMAAALDARVGGGQSFGGGGGGGWGGGGGGGGGFILYLLLNLILRHPLIGVPILIAIIIFYAYSERLPRFSSARGSAATTLVRSASTASLAELRREDPNFSRPLFLDFLRLLYVRTQEARGRGDYDTVRPYLDAEVITSLPRPADLDGVTDVIVGAAEIVRVGIGPRRVTLRVRLEANYTEHRGSATPEQWFVRETWTIARDAGVLSKGPEEIRTLGCPSCGSPVELTPDGRCRHCGAVTRPGSLHWEVQQIIVMDRQHVRPLEIATGGGPEPGLERPTVYAPDFVASRKLFMGRYPEFSWDEFTQRVERSFTVLNEAWSSKRWEEARPYETDALFDRHRYWIERYKAQGLSNVTENTIIENIEPCRIEQDAYYESITVRIFASMIDYTVEDASGRVVGGSQKTPRRFSEYWTFIRRIGFDPTKKKDDRHCPSCGAPLRVNMAGVCEYCKAHVTSGDFDWVLTSIDQDETYRG